MKWKFPLKTEAASDSAPVYVRDQNGREVARFQRSDDPANDLAVAKWYAWELTAVHTIGLP